MKIHLSFLFVIVSIASNAQTFQLQLDQNWEFRQASENKWLPAKVPGAVHTDLFENGLIPHPFVGNNEMGLQWISDESWIYQTEFRMTKEQLETRNIELVFEGLDTYAKVYLNGELVMNASNAFRIWRADVKKLLKRKNKLQVEFLPAKIIEERKKGKITYELPEGNRIFTRKAQFQYGWDWAPGFNTTGIWRGVYLECWNSLKIKDFYVKQVYLDENDASLDLEINIDSEFSDEILLDVFLNRDKMYSIRFNVHKGIHKIVTPLKISNPKRWWTHNLGEPYLYEFKVQVKDLKGKSIDEKTIKKGLRTIELMTEKDDHGESFYFKLNGEPVYMKGANYIPQSSFQNWVSARNYEELLNDAVDSNMNMLRVWGGGIYEDDRFYSLCDEKGILVWQDFMFACAMYPGDEDFLENVRLEAVENVKRLRNHSSVALWCGNNESSEGWQRWGWQDGRSEAEKAEIWGNYQKLFSGILPDVVKEFTDLPYWESSPKFGRGDERYISEGDAHDWWIWHDGRPFEDLAKKIPRFMSEFGFQSFPSLETIKFINGGNSSSISSEELKSHQKHSRGFEIIRTYMERDFPVPANEEDYVYVSQLLQAYGVGMGIEAQRRNKPYTMGSLYWQLNDCWPAVSWSGIDSSGNWKALQYQAKHSFQDVLVSFEREGDELKVFIVNDQLQPLSGNLKVDVIDFKGNVLKNYSMRVYVEKNVSESVFKFDLKNLKKMEREIFVRASYLDSASSYYLVKPKDLNLEKEGIEIQINPSEKGFQISLQSNVLQKNVFLSSEVKGEFDTNFFDILPNNSYLVTFKTNAKEFRVEDLKIKTLNDLVN